MGWQPIETAPKTGNYLLLYRPECEGAMEGFWREGGLTCDRTREIPSGWVLSIDPDTPYPIEPTHWQYMPEPPQKRSQSAV